MGDILLLHEEEQVPVDCLLLGSNYSNGLGYIETASLDGERSLKPK